MTEIFLAPESNIHAGYARNFWRFMTGKYLPRYGRWVEFITSTTRCLSSQTEDGVEALWRNYVTKLEKRWWIVDIVWVEWEPEEDTED